MSKCTVQHEEPQVWLSWAISEAFHMFRIKYYGRRKKPNGRGDCEHCCRRCGTNPVLLYPESLRQMVEIALPAV